MLALNSLVIACVFYVILLFGIAFWADRRTAYGRHGFLGSPIIYTLSLSVYCTAWTFYGAVGNAAARGLEFVAIYLGPSLVLIGWLWFLRKLVRVGRAQRVTSIADLLSSRYGKSTLLGVLVTVLAMVGTTPYISLQLQSVTLSFEVFSGDAPFDRNNAALWVAGGLALFTILFGTRNLDANERHYGVVTAIAFEAVVKLVALLAVGAFVIWGVAGGLPEMAERINESRIADWELNPARWAGLIFLSAAAFLTLPRMFQVMVVENASDRNLSTASWAFPLYLMLMSLFVLPIAVVGLELLPAGANPDLFVVTVPLSLGENQLALLAFLGGFSSATSMVIVASIAISTMISNHIVLPVWLATRKGGATISGDVRHVILTARRWSIIAILGLGYLYYRYSGGASLAAIGLIAFTGVSQVLPAMLAGMFWRRATRIGAGAGIITGFAVWAYALLVPSMGMMPPEIISEGLFGLNILRPQALFGTVGMDPVIHAVMWSMLLNASALVLFSLLSVPTPLERLQSAQFVTSASLGAGPTSWSTETAGAEELLVMSQRILGGDEAHTVFRKEAERQGKSGFLPDLTQSFLDGLEKEISGSVGAATAHAMIAQILGGTRVTVQDLMALADETVQIMEYSSQLEAKSVELERTARQLREANDKLTELSEQKDAFLSQISHELRTPMTSIRAFSEILMDMSDLDVDEQKHYANVIHGESIRLTRLLDDLLDLSVLENGEVQLNVDVHNLGDIIEQALLASGVGTKRQIKVRRNPEAEKHEVSTDRDRLAQVLINLLTNAYKYCDNPEPELKIKVTAKNSEIYVDIVDNGSGISVRNQTIIFEKFSRLSDQQAAGGAGLGLSICREIMGNLGGTIEYLPGQGGAAFRVTLPR